MGNWTKTNYFWQRKQGRTGHCSGLINTNLKQAALLTLQPLLPAIAISLLLIEVESKRDLLADQGLALELVSIQI